MSTLSRSLKITLYVQTAILQIDIWAGLWHIVARSWCWACLANDMEGYCFSRIWTEQWDFGIINIGIPLAHWAAILSN